MKLTFPFTWTFHSGNRNNSNNDTSSVSSSTNGKFPGPIDNSDIIAEETQHKVSAWNSSQIFFLLLGFLVAG